MGWLRHSLQGVRKQRTSRASLSAPLTCSQAAHWPPYSPAPDGLSPHRRDQSCDTTSALVRGVGPVGNHHIPTSLRSTVVTRFLATTDALTPTGPGLAACRGSLIHVSLTSDHAVSNHLECSHSRDPLPQRCGPYGVRASPGHRRLASTPGRIKFTWWPTGHRVTAWSFSSRCSPPGGIAPMQLRSDTGPTVSARSGTLTPLSLSALRRTMPPLTGLGNCWVGSVRRYR
jgi:hypothetical protein